jgi:hypothetical protein
MLGKVVTPKMMRCVTCMRKYRVLYQAGWSPQWPCSQHLIQILLPSHWLQSCTAYVTLVGIANQDMIIVCTLPNKLMLFAVQRPCQFNITSGSQKVDLY